MVLACGCWETWTKITFLYWRSFHLVEKWSRLGSTTFNLLRKAFNFMISVFTMFLVSKFWFQALQLPAYYLAFIFISKMSAMHPTSDCFWSRYYENLDCLCIIELLLGSNWWVLISIFSVLDSKQWRLFRLVEKIVKIA